MDITKSMLNSVSNNNTPHAGGYSSNNSIKNPYKIDNPYTGGEEDISWLL